MTGQPTWIKFTAKNDGYFRQSPGHGLYSASKNDVSECPPHEFMYTLQNAYFFAPIGL